MDYENKVKMTKKKGLDSLSSRIELPLTETGNAYETVGLALGQMSLVVFGRKCLDWRNLSGK